MEFTEVTHPQQQQQKSHIDDTTVPGLQISAIRTARKCFGCYI
jgi:hypothetical protein